MPVKVRFPGSDPIRGLRLRSALRRTAQDIGFVERPEANPREATQRLVAFLRSISEGGSTNVRVQWSHDPELLVEQPRAQRSMLKAAYLAAFDCLGYPYVLSPQLEVIQRQMREPEKDIFSVYLVSHPQTADVIRQIVLGYVYEPEPIKSIAVFFLGYWLRRLTVVFLPIPAHPGLPAYDRLLEVAKGAGCLAYVSIDRSVEQLVTDKELIMVSEDGAEYPIYPQE